MAAGSARPSLADLAAAEGRPAPAVDDDPLDALLPGHARFHRVDEAEHRAGWAWQASICPDFPTISEDVSHAPAAERKATFWSRCLDRFDFVTREEYLTATSDSGMVGFALHHWLTQQAHVDDAIATPLARAVVLGGHWLVRPPTGLRLPVVEAGAKIEEGVVLELRPGSIHFGGRRVATLDAMGRPDPRPEPTPSHAEPIIGPLYDSSAEEVDKGTQMAESRGATWSTPLLLVAHCELPWSTLRPVLASAVLAGFRRVELVGLVDDQANPLRTVTVHDATASSAPLVLADTTTVQALVDTVLARKDGAPRLLP